MSGKAADAVPTRFVHGYVLAGGLSSRMGRDKALLELAGTTILRRTYDLLLRICGQATIVGPEERYSSLGFPLIEDLRSGCGPLAGIEAALADCRSEWALVVACDMPRLEDAGLAELLVEAERAGPAHAVVPVSATGRPEPMCAVYRPQALEVVRKQLEKGHFKLSDAIESMPAKMVVLNRPHHFLNVNRPEDWEALHVRG